jgi:hypothetical protein
VRGLTSLTSLASLSLQFLELISIYRSTSIDFSLLKMSTALGNNSSSISSSNNGTSTLPSANSIRAAASGGDTNQSSRSIGNPSGGSHYVLGHGGATMTVLQQQSETSSSSSTLLSDNNSRAAIFSGRVVEAPNKELKEIRAISSTIVAKLAGQLAVTAAVDAQREVAAVSNNPSVPMGVPSQQTVAQGRIEQAEKSLALFATATLKALLVGVKEFVGWCSARGGTNYKGVLLPTAKKVYNPFPSHDTIEL